MKKKIALITMVASLILVTGCGTKESAFPNASFDVGVGPRAWASVRAVFVSGKSELQNAVAAKNAAKSWRMKTEMRLHPGEPLVTTAEVSCPDHERMIGQLGESQYEAIRVGGEAFVRANEGSWQKSSATADFYPCGGSPGMRAPWAIMNEGRDLTSVLSKLVDASNATAVRGPLVRLDGAVCQEWTVQFRHPDKNGNDRKTPSDKKMSYSICLDTGTHLPRQIVMGTGGVVTSYYDWNAPVDVQVPTENIEVAKQ
ncbi:MAG: hypothetical protein WAL32_14690 [Terriglobales bacterium]